MIHHLLLIHYNAYTLHGCNSSFLLVSHCTQSIESVLSGLAELRLVASYNLTGVMLEMPASVISLSRLEEDMKLTIKYVSHPGRNLSSSSKLSVPRYVHKASTDAKQLSTWTVARLITREKSVMALVPLTEEVEGVEEP